MASPELEALLRDHLSTAQRTWPTIVVEPAEFFRHLAERLPADVEAEGALHHVHAADLYLACALCHGDRIAIAMFDEHYLSQVGSYLAKTNAAAEFSDEVRQALRERLLVAREGVAPKIAGYTGRGPLGGWLRMVTVRLAIDLHHREQGRPGTDAQAWLPLRSQSDDPELKHMKATYSREFRAAFQSTLAALPAQEASLLRMHFLEGMTADAIGKIYRVNGRTVRRWIAQSRQKILAETRRLLEERLRLGGSEWQSVLRLLESDLEASIERYLP